MQDVEDAIKKRLSEVPEDAMLGEEVGPEEVAQIVSRWTGIPVSKLQQGERDRLLQLNEELHQRVVGQDKAVEVCRSHCTLHTSRVGTINVEYIPCCGLLSACKLHTSRVGHYCGYISCCVKQQS